MSSGPFTKWLQQTILLKIISVETGFGGKWPRRIYIYIYIYICMCVCVCVCVCANKPNNLT